MTEMEELLKALKSLISDIENMKDSDTWFGAFSVYDEDGWNSGVRIEWPNLAISLENVKTALAQFEGQS